MTHAPDPNGGSEDRGQGMEGRTAGLPATKLTVGFFILTLLVVALAVIWFHSIALSVELQAPGGKVQVFWSPVQGKFSETNSAFSDSIEPGHAGTYSVSIPSRGVRDLRIDPGWKPGVVRIFKVSVSGFFLSKSWEGPELARQFRPFGNVGPLHYEDGALSTTALTADPALGFLAASEVGTLGRKDLLLTLLLSVLGIVILFIIWRYLHRARRQAKVLQPGHDRQGIS